MDRLSDIKHITRSLWSTMDTCDPSSLTLELGGFLDQNAVWQGFKPVQNCRGASEIVDHFWRPLRESFAHFERETHILMAGVSDGKQASGQDGRMWVGATGYFHVTQTQPVFGVPAFPKSLKLRWAEFLEFDETNKITRIQFMIDVIDWLEQINCSPLPRPKGAAHVYPAPTGINGMDFPNTGSEATLHYARNFIFGGLNAFDSADLSSMKMADFFHPNVKWYGPGGIGACMSFKEFETLHQRPWLVAFPDRKVQDLDNLIAEGAFFAGSSMPGVHATHTGPYLGHRASGQPLAINGIDFWIIQNNQITENWVFVDMIDLFDQMGVDLMQSARYLAEVV